MRGHTQRLLAVLTAVIALGIAASSADAAKLRFEFAGNIALSSLGLVTFSSTLATVTCRITFHGSLIGGELEKLTGTRYGRLTEGTTRIGETRACNGEGLISALLVEPLRPWSVNYNSILGTLPNNITGILFELEPVKFLIEISGVQCLYEVREVGVLLGVTGTNPYTSTLLRILTGVGIPRKEGNMLLCPREGRLDGGFSFTAVQTVTRA